MDGTGDRSIEAWHEAGHAVCALLLPDAADPVRVTLGRCGSSAASAWLTRGGGRWGCPARARARLIVAMGGSSGEEALFGGGTGAAAEEDRVAARALAARIVARHRSAQVGAHGLADPFPGPVEAAVDDLLADSLAAARALHHYATDLLETLAGELLAADTVPARRLRQLRRDWDLGQIESVEE
jgi:ATP-dependent Zn protease